MVETIAQRIVEQSRLETLDEMISEVPPRAKVLDGKQEAKVNATSLGGPPKLRKQDAS